MKRRVLLPIAVFLVIVVLAAFSPGIAFAGSVNSIQGSDRFETAAKEAFAAYPGGSETVIVAGSEAWADALSALGLAGALDCPILFVEKGSVPGITSQSIESLGASEIVLLGSEDSVSLAAEQALESVRGVEKVRRVGGDDRFSTQMEIYDFGRTGYDGKDHWGHGIAIVASGMNFPDALSVSPLAFSQAAPVFLVGGSGQLSFDQEVALLDGMFERVVVVGSSSCVADETLGYLEALTMASSSDSMSKAVRLAGVDRYETNALVARWCVDQGYLAWNSLAFASGSLPYDALGGGVVQGKRRAVLLMADHVSDSSIAAAVANRASLSTITYFGSTAAVSDHLRKEIEYRLGWYAPSVSEVLNWIELASGSYGIAPINTDFLPTGSNYSQLDWVLTWMRSSGYSVGFTMVDLKTGQGLSSGSNQVFYSASTIKGPYVASLNKYQPSLVWGYSGIMQQTINVSSNSGYATLRYSFGSWPFSQYMADAQVRSFSSNTWYPYFRVKDLAKLWVANYDYFYGASQNVNSAFCRGLFTSSYHSPIYYEMGGQHTVYSKPGWINQDSPRTFNDSGIVMAGDRPYLVTICSDAWERYDMLQALVRALDSVHREMVG